MKTFKPSEGLLDLSKKSVTPPAAVVNEQLYSGDVGLSEFLGFPKVQQESGEFS